MGEENNDPIVLFRITWCIPVQSNGHLISSWGYKPQEKFFKTKEGAEKFERELKAAAKVLGIMKPCPVIEKFEVS